MLLCLLEPLDISIFSDCKKEKFFNHTKNKITEFDAERSSSADINPSSYHLIAFELINPLYHSIFPCFEYSIFLKDLKSTLWSSVTL